MQNLVKGKAVSVDVGFINTKIIYSDISKTEINLLDFEIFQTPKDIFLSGAIKNYSKLAKFIEECLTEMGVKCRRVLLSSSRLSIDSIIREYNTSNVSEVQSMFENDDDGRRFPTNTKIRDIQTYGSYPTEDEIRFVNIISTANIEQMMGVYKEFREVGLTILSITSTSVSFSKLIQTIKMSYDKQTKLMIDFGSKITMTLMINGTPRYIDSIVPEMAEFIEYLSTELDVSEYVITQAMSRVGVVYTENSTEVLYSLGIIDYDMYFDKLAEQLSDLFVLLDDKVQNIRDLFQEDISEIICSGGVIECPGIADISENNLKVLKLSDIYSSKEVNINNKLGVEIPTIMLVQVGSMLNVLYRNNCNLLPTEKLAKSLDEYIVTGIKSICVITLIVSLIMSISLISNTVELISLRDIDNRISSAKDEKSKFQIDIKRLNEYIGASEAASMYLSDLIMFIQQYNNEFITVASIDSASLLKTEPEPVAIEVEDEKSKDKKVQEEVNTEIDVKETLGVIEDDLVLRGYSVSSAAISSLYTNLSKLEFVVGVDMGEITQEILPSLETIYIFEIKIKL